VGEYFAAQLGVEQRDGNTHSGEAKPDGHIIWRVRHQQADAIAAPKTLGDGPSGIPTAIRSKLAVA
jgi:hypothetical protein